MLKEIELNDIVDKEENFIVLNGSGRILKVFVEFLKTDSSLNLTIFTRNGEEIINIQNDEIKKVLYPRANISSGKYSKDALSGEKDYYYFFGGLLLYIEKKEFFPKTTQTDFKDPIFEDLNDLEESERIVNKLTILYEDLK